MYYYCVLVGHKGPFNNYMDKMREEGTVVEVNSDPAPLIISKIFRFRVLWSKSKSMFINKWMLSVRN